MTCLPPELRVEERINRVLTQYRESPNMLSVLRTDLGQIAEVSQSLCTMLDYFDLTTAVGDQLTILGKRLGWPRCHCVCLDTQPKFGFNCGGVQNMFGFCEGGVWANCDASGIGELCITDDELYRRFLQVRRYQVRKLWDYASLLASVRILWGEQATVWTMGQARVVIVPGRALTTAEQALMQLAMRVLPIAPGIMPFVSYAQGKIFGFGTGWGGFCDNPDAEGEQLVSSFRFQNSLAEFTGFNARLYTDPAYLRYTALDAVVTPIGINSPSGIGLISPTLIKTRVTWHWDAPLATPDMILQWARASDPDFSSSRQVVVTGDADPSIWQDVIWDLRAIPELQVEPLDRFRLLLWGGVRDPWPTVSDGMKVKFIELWTEGLGHSFWLCPEYLNPYGCAGDVLLPPPDPEPEPPPEVDPGDPPEPPPPDPDPEPEPPPTETETLYRSWNATKDWRGWEAVNGSDALINNGILVIRNTGAQPGTQAVARQLSSLSRVGRYVNRFRITLSWTTIYDIESWNVTLRALSGTLTDWSYAMSKTVQHPGPYNTEATLTFDMDDVPDWLTRSITQIQFEFFGSSIGNALIKSIEVLQVTRT